MSNAGRGDIPQLEGNAQASEALAGWLLWLSLFTTVVFALLCVTGEVGRGIAAGGLVLSLALFLYERRRVRSAGQWIGGMGGGCATGIVLAGFGGKLLDLSGLFEVWDSRDQLTLTGLIVLWTLVAVGMGLVATWTPPVKTAEGSQRR